jgi:Tfp pilus assembly protein PilO
MSAWVNKLNLRPGELRLVVVVASVIVVVLYALFIVPQFNEWSANEAKKKDLEQKLRRYAAEIAREATYRKELAGLKEKGASVDTEAQALELQRSVNSQAALHGVTINGYTPGKGPAGGTGRTNAYFEETTGTINFVAEESALVNFLYALSSGNSLIRVSSMTLNPEASRMKLMGNMTLVASYKKAPPKAAIPTGPTASPASGVRPAPAGPGPKSISGAVSASTKPAVTNRPPSLSLWSKIKGVFSPGKSTNAPSPKPGPTNAPARKPGPPNVPPVKK